MRQQTSRGFALLDVFLAVIILVVITVGSYQLMGAYRNTSNIQTLQSDMMNVSQAYAPLLNQTAIQYSGTEIINNGKMLTCFLLNVPIPKERLTDTDQNPCTNNSYGYIKTSLFDGSGNSNLGFAVLTVNASAGVPAQQYFVAGVKANCTQTTQMIQMMNNSFGLFYGDSTKDIKNSNEASGLPSCVDKTTIYNVYFVSPKINDASQFSSSFTAP